MSSETREDLQAKINELQLQLQQIRVALSVTPGDENLLNLESNLQDAIKLTQDLLTLQQVSGSSLVEAALTAGAAIERDENSLLRHQLTITLNEPKEPKHLQVGTTCQAIYAGDNQWYPAKVIAMPGRGLYNVEFFGYGTTAEVDSTSIRPAPKVRPGQKCQVFYAEEMQWFDAEVVSLNELAATCRVLVKGYKAADEVRTVFVRQPVAESLKRTFDKIVGDGTSEAIPEKLKILPTDSQETKTAKKRKLHAIKGRNRLREIEEERNTRQQSWKSFESKNTRTTKGTGTFLANTRKKDSIFKSPDSVDGKVGVTNSGKTMTDFGAGYKYKPVIVPRALEEIGD